MKKKHKSLKVSLLISILVIILIWSIFYINKNEMQSSNLETQKSENQLIGNLPTASPIKNAQNNILKNYISRKGGFSIKYPAGYELIADEKAKKIQILSDVIPDINTNLRFTIAYINISNRFNKAKKLKDLIDENPVCESKPLQNGILGNINGYKLAQIYPDTPCGKYMQTVIYTLNEKILYIITIESYAKFYNVKSYADKLFSTLEFTQPISE